MVDWKKDIKLSDLLARKSGAEEGREEAPIHADEGRQDDPQVEAAEVERMDDEPTAETPFWKRDLRFRRQKGEVEPDPEFETTSDESERRSFFRRELSFGRPKHDDAGDTAFDEPDAQVEEKTPFWKRELSFGRGKDKVDATDEQEELGRDELETAEERTPFWKRELSFGRRQGGLEVDQEREELPPDELEPVGEVSEAKTPFWKRELSFGRGKDDRQEDWDDHATPSEHSLEEESTEEKTPFWKRELSFGRTKDEQDDSELDAPLAEPEEKTPFWKRELSFGRRKGDLGDGEEQEELAHEELEPVAAAPDLRADTDAEPASEELTSEPEPMVAAVPEPDALDDSSRDLDDSHDEPAPLVTPVHEVVAEEEKASFAHEDVEAEEPAPLVASAPEADAAEDAPFWKREIKFGRRRGDAGLEPTPVGGPEPTYGELVDLEPLADQEKKSFFKRELSFRRSKDPDFDAPKPEKRSLFKRDLSFGRGEKDSEVEADFAAPAAERRPFFKRELSLRRGKGGGSDLGAKRSGGRTKQLVGLKVGASQIAAARITNNATPELVQLARQPIDQGIVVGGELRDPDALAEALREFFSKHKLPNRNVRLGIGNNRIGVRSFEISGVQDPKQLENAVRFRAQEALPIPLDEAVLDYHVVGESVSPTGIRTYRVLLVVAYRELVDRYVAACRDAGLRLVGIDLEAFALLRALSPAPSEGFPEDTALVVVSIGHDRSTFAVSNGTVCEFTRVLDWGGSSLNTAIARTLDVTPSQAEPVKRTVALNRGEEGVSTPVDEHSARAEEAVRLELQSFARELVSSLHFYQNQPGSLAIGSIMLTGGTAHLPGLGSELQRLIGVRVRVGDPLRRVKTAKRVEAPDQVGSMAVAIGLGIED
jgi:type IV pilus assembly protein PilM